MTATNHVITGSVFVAVAIDILPLWFILPVVFLLHFVLDSLPHFGTPHDELGALKRLRWILPFDAAVAAAILLAIVTIRPVHWQLIALGGVLCASPDLWSASRFVRFIKHGHTHINSDWFAQFHHRVQWGERPWGVWVELVWFVGMSVMLLPFLRIG